MIQKIQINNFKCFQKQNFELKPMTILAGANGAGKSSLIQALLLLQASYKATPKTTELKLSDIFPHSIGAVSQLIAQDFLGVPEIKISTQIDNQEAFITFVPDGSNKQRLIGHGTIQSISREQFPTFQYLNAERIGPRLHTGFGESEILISSDGQNAAYLVEIADQNEYLISSNLLNDEEPKKFSYQVEKYIAAIMGNVRLKYDTDYDSTFIRTMLQTDAADHPVTQPLTGFGYSYAFPIVVAGLLCSCFPNMVLLVENPEAHLHPHAQSNIGKFLALLTGCGIQVIIETHSEHIIDGARIQFAYEQKTDRMRVYFFSYDKQGTFVEQIEVTAKGELTSWPRGFFDQKQTDLRELMRMRRV